MIYSAKYNNKFKVFILHPEYGYRKLVVNVSKYIGKDTFVAITAKGKETKLYLNVDLVSTVQREDVVSSLEIGDFVMVKICQGDLKNVNIPTKVEVIQPAEVQSLNGETATFYFFQSNEIVVLPINKLIS